MLTFQITDFGYVIYRDGELLITQDQVPGVAGRVPFESDIQKLECAQAAIQELTPPAATVEG